MWALFSRSCTGTFFSPGFPETEVFVEEPLFFFKSTLKKINQIFRLNLNLIFKSYLQISKNCCMKDFLVEWKLNAPITNINNIKICLLMTYVLKTGAQKVLWNKNECEINPNKIAQCTESKEPSMQRAMQELNHVTQCKYTYY